MADDENSTQPSDHGENDIFIDSHNNGGVVRKPSIVNTSMVTEKDEVMMEILAAKAGHTEKNSFAEVSMSDAFFYEIENRISSAPAFPFIMLAFVFVSLLVLLSIAWYFASHNHNEVYGSENLSDSVNHVLQLLTAGGGDDSIPDINGLRFFHFISIFLGLIVFAALVGFINDSIKTFMENLSLGKTKVCEDNHTLILGFNEATLRVVVQISFLRRQYQMLNESKLFGLVGMLPLLKPLFEAFGLLERPSTSLAANDIVIMTNTKTKEEMHTIISQGLAERGISPKRTKLGQNIICRVGDPTNVNDLIRARAYKASAIILMMTDQDIEEEDASDFKIRNGATLRTVLALRHVIFNYKYSDEHEFNPDLRMVLQMSSPSSYVDASAFSHFDGREVIIPMDLTPFLNSLMFNCAAQPGLAKVIMSILDFEGASIRRRRVKNLKCGPNGEYGYAAGMTFGEMRKQFTKAIFIGVIRPSMGTDTDTICENGFGLCPKNDTVIDSEDMLIFIGPKSNPVNNPEMVDRMNNYVAQAAKFKQQVIDNNSDAQEAIKRKIISNILVCGWRPVWAEVPRRLYDRIKEVASKRLPGSRLIFVNGMSFEDFSHLMHYLPVTQTREGIMPTEDEEGNTIPAVSSLFAMNDFDGIVIEHLCGDAAEPETLEPIVMNNTIHTAIVLGTQANIRLSSRFRDTRVLSILLLLRKIWNVKNEGIPMHTVGENQADLTARLALGPKPLSYHQMTQALASAKSDNDAQEKLRSNSLNTGRSTTNNVREPDFINTQAIYARVLTQTLAYPVIRPAISDLFNESKGSADVEIVRASAYIPLDQTYEWGIVRAAVLQAENERSICIGWMDMGGEVSLLPDVTEIVRLGANDSLILIRRMLDLEED